MRTVVGGFALGALWLQQFPSLPDLRTNVLFFIGFVVSACGAAVIGRHGSSGLNDRRSPSGLRVRAALCWILAATAGVQAGIGWAAWRADIRLAVALPEAFEGRDLQVTGQVTGLPVMTPDGVRFAFAIESGAPPVDTFPRRVLLSLHDAEAGSRIRPGQHWALSIRLRRPHRAVNFHAPAAEANLLEQNFRAVGYIRTQPAPVLLGTRFAIEPRVFVERMRARIRDRIAGALVGRAHTGIIVALAIGDQSLITAKDQLSFARTGTRHLIAVSGLHVSLVAGAAFGLLSLVWRRAWGLAGRAPLWLATPRLASVAGALAAFAYAAIAGLGVPALRAFVMLAAAASATFAGRRVATSTVFCAALGAVVLIDPWAVLTAGFWLSFGAVAAILLVGDGGERRAREGPCIAERGDDHDVDGRVDGDIDSAVGRGGERASDNRTERIAGWFARARDHLRGSMRSATRAQWAVTIALVPASLFWFAQVPLVGPLANAIAIPWASLIVTPLTLAGVIAPAPLDGIAWRLAHASVDLLMSVVDGIGSPAWAVLPLRAPDGIVVTLAAIGAVWVLMPAGWPMRHAGWLLWLPLGMSPGVLPGPLSGPLPGLLPGSSASGAIGPGEFRVTVFDVGQGAATLVDTRTHHLLFDAGPRYGPGSDAGRSIVAPAIAALGIRRLDRLVVSHADADHAGGMESVMETVGIDSLRASLPADDPAWQSLADAGRCRAGQTWEWDGVRFEMLWPDEATSDGGYRNAASCVLRISNPRVAALLPGDIEAAQERTLVANLGPALRADLLIAPHHGSRTSSTEAFLDSVAPRDAVFQVGYLNHSRQFDPSSLPLFVLRPLLQAALRRTSSLLLPVCLNFLNRPVPIL